ncbi:hypothetical protein KKG36_00620 [Patescibacteria group bacterium]|nr:hypothetical protein [Patescibacteria group bacterium]
MKKNILSIGVAVLSLAIPAVAMAQGNILVDVLNSVQTALLAIFLAAAAIFIIIGAFQFLTGGGDATKVKEARDKVLYALIAVVVAFAATGLVALAKSFVK